MKRRRNVQIVCFVNGLRLGNVTETRWQPGPGILSFIHIHIFSAHTSDKCVALTFNVAVFMGNCMRHANQFVCYKQAQRLRGCEPNHSPHEQIHKQKKHSNIFCLPPSLLPPFSAFLRFAHYIMDYITSQVNSAEIKKRKHLGKY